MAELAAGTVARASRLPWTVGTLALLAVAVRLPGAIRDSFWQDEVASAKIIVQPSFPDMLRTVRATEATPPLWYALGWALHELGLSPYGYRFLDLAFAALLAAATYALARRLLPSAPALAATLVVVLGYQFVFHGHELRAYELYALLTVLFALALLRAVERSSRGRLAALAAVVAAGSLTSYFFLLFLACGLLWLWLDGREGTRLPVAIALLAGLVPLLPWIPAAVAQYRHHHFSFIGPFRAFEAVSSYWLLVARIDPRTPVLHWLAPCAALAVVLAAAALLARRSGAGRMVALFAVLPVLVVAAVWAAGPEVFDPRNLLGAGPFAAIAVAAPFTRLSVRVAAATGVVAVGLLAYGYVGAEATPPTDYQAIARALVREGWSPRAPIVLYDGNFFAFRGPLEWYLPGRPALTLGRPTGTDCAAGYAIVVGARNRLRLAHRLRWTAASTTTGVTAARLPAPVRLSRPLRAVHVMTARAGHAACVHPLPERELRASS